MVNTVSTYSLVFSAMNSKLIIKPGMRATLKSTSAE